MKHESWTEKSQQQGQQIAITETPRKPTSNMQTNRRNMKNEKWGLDNKSQQQ